MTRVRKSKVEPENLSISYRNDNVYGELLKNQDDKCYLCERIVSTNYQIDHLKSKNNFPNLEKNWKNLFLTCDYCNQKKSNNFDNILNPEDYDIEKIIKHSNEFFNKKVIFSSGENSDEIEETIRLLSKLFNGNNGLRNKKEERFYDEFIQKFNIFLKIINDYLSISKEEYRNKIENELNIKSEFLGFKYTIIMENQTLKQDFGHLIIWNKSTKTLN